MAVVDARPSSQPVRELPKSPQSEAQRKPLRIAGWLFVITFVTSIPAMFLYEPLLKHANYILGPGVHTRIALGAFLEILLAIANIGTAVVLYPILKRQSQRHQPWLCRQSHPRINRHPRRGESAWVSWRLQTLERLESWTEEARHRSGIRLS